MGFERNAILSAFNESDGDFAKMLNRLIKDLVDMFLEVEYFWFQRWNIFVKNGFERTAILSAFNEFDGDYEKMLEQLTEPEQTRKE